MVGDADDSVSNFIAYRITFEVISCGKAFYTRAELSRRVATGTQLITVFIFKKPFLLLLTVGPR
jgi:hypothetical protein